MEQEREFTLTMKTRNLLLPASTLDTSATELHKYHYRILDEAFLHLFTLEPASYDTKIASHQGLAFAVEEARIGHKEKLLDLMHLQQKTYARQHAGNDSYWPYKTVLTLEKDSSCNRLLSQPLRDILYTYIPHFESLTLIPLVEYNRTKQALYPSDNALHRRLVQYIQPTPPLLSRYSCNLHVTTDASNAPAQPQKIIEITPLNDMGYGLYQLCHLDLGKIGSGVSGAIKSWDLQRDYIRLVKKTPAEGPPGLYLLFSSEIFRHLAETATYKPHSLAEDRQQLSIQIGSFTSDNEVSLSTDFLSYRKKLAEQSEAKKSLIRNPAIRPIAQRRSQTGKSL